MRSFLVGAAFLLLFLCVAVGFAAALTYGLESPRVYGRSVYVARAFLGVLATLVFCVLSRLFGVAICGR